MLRLVLAVVVVLGSNLAWACKCASPPDVMEAVAAGSAVFVGKVAEVKTADRMNTVTFVATKGWKGVKGRDVVVITPSSGPACGLDFQKDKEYLVYADADDKGDHMAHRCGRTTALATAAEDLKQLGKPMWEGK